MMIEATKCGTVLVAAVLEPRVDARTGSALHAALRSRISDGDRRIVLDLKSVRFIDSTGLGALVASLKHVGIGGALVLCGVSESVGTLLKLTRMDKLFRCFPTRDLAVTALTES